MSDFWVGRYLKQNRTKSDKVGRYVRKNGTSDNVRKKWKIHVKKIYIEFAKRREQSQTKMLIPPTYFRN